MNEITFATPLDAACFNNQNILVSHEKRISIIKKEKYWREID